jgi:hypothetical protein
MSKWIKGRWFWLAVVVALLGGWLLGKAALVAMDAPGLEVGMTLLKEAIGLLLFPVAAIVVWRIWRSNTVDGRLLRRWGRKQAELHRRSLSGRD